ncbi:MAG: hypothetical protein AB1497_02650 [Bacillota bacterium]
MYNCVQIRRLLPWDAERPCVLIEIVGNVALGAYLYPHFLTPCFIQVSARSGVRLTDPGSKLYVSQWFPRTALPQLLGLRSEDVYDERLYRAMDDLLPARCAVESAVSSKLREVGQDLRVLLYLRRRW